MKISRHHVLTGAGADFWMKEESKAKRFAEKTNGKYLGFVEVPQANLPPCLQK